VYFAKRKIGNFLMNLKNIPSAKQAMSKVGSLIDSVKYLNSSPLKEFYQMSTTERYVEKLEKKVYEKYTSQLERVLEEQIDGNNIVWYYHTITGENVAFYLDENDNLVEFKRVC
jgi:hypothetical protein